MKTDWDYSERAHTYDKRADYSYEAISELIKNTNCDKNSLIADIGAGTGKLTKILVSYDLKVNAVEPNDNMRMYGIKNTEGMRVNWSEGVGENTGLQSESVNAAFFGSSFNVVNTEKTLMEVSRILKAKGWFSCMWNHRDTEDKLQKEIEKIIFKYIPNYSYGSRRTDPSQTILSSKNFNKVEKISKGFSVDMKRQDIIEAWESHDTLYRQSNGKFKDIIKAISELLTEDVYSIPYNTRIWFSQIEK
tara:strand:+ start:379 stop:1119 length:741 start_codon:yes stop_codon:yes gene_type:complete